MAESILGVLAAVLGFVAWLIRRRAAQTDAKKPEEDDAQRDRDLVDPDPRALSVRLQRLWERARRRRGAR